MKINIDKIEIKLCENKDIEELLNIQNIVLSEFKEEEKGYFYPYTRKEFEKIFSNTKKCGNIYAAIYNEKMIAWIVLSTSEKVNKLLEYIPDTNGGTADIDGVMVLKEYRGNGIQNILVEYVEKKAKELNIKNILAEVTIGNNYSLENLIKLGYKIKTTFERNKYTKRYLLIKKIEYINLIEE